MARRRRILHVIKTLDQAGGAEVLLLRLAKALREDHRVEVAHLMPGSGVLADNLEESGVRVHQLGRTPPKSSS